MKRIIKSYIAPLYFNARWHYAVTFCAILFVVAFFLPWLGIVPYAVIFSLAVMLIFDYIMLFSNRTGIFGSRSHAERFSNGDENTVRINLENRYAFLTQVEIIDEIPFQFQRRDVLFELTMAPGENKVVEYRLRPVKRGGYHFGTINVYVTGRIGMVKRRYQFEQPAEVPVYPSYIQMRKYQLLAISNRLSEAGVKKIRRLGHSMEFEQIKEYVQGDDYRTLNWKATARKGQLMVNNFTDEKSQQIYCIIDKGRVMKMPFDGLSLLDYAINASLVLSNVALIKHDKAGLVTFSEQMGAFLPASNRAIQMQAILEILYNQKTRYLESDFELLYSTLRVKVSQRSLVVLFTNFESMSGMKRQLPYLRRIATHHLLVIVFFENTELKKLVTEPADNIEEVYTKTVAEKFAFEKRLIAKELQHYGIHSILTTPQLLTVRTINKYLELKAKQAI